MFLAIYISITIAATAITKILGCIFDFEIQNGFSPNAQIRCAKQAATYFVIRQISGTKPNFNQITHAFGDCSVANTAEFCSMHTGYGYEISLNVELIGFNLLKINYKISPPPPIRWSRERLHVAEGEGAKWIFLMKMEDPRNNGQFSSVHMHAQAYSFVTLNWAQH